MAIDELTSAFLGIRNKMHRIAMRLLRNDEDARDAVQDTFEKLWTRNEIKTDDEARNKLVCVLHNTCIDHLRGKHTVQLDLSVVGNTGCYEMPTEDIAEYERLFLNGLTDLQKKIYAMVTHECLEYEEISRRIGMSVEAVRMNMSRARKLIRENIKIIDQ